MSRLTPAVGTRLQSEVSRFAAVRQLEHVHWIRGDPAASGPSARSNNDWTPCDSLPRAAKASLSDVGVVDGDERCSRIDLPAGVPVSVPAPSTVPGQRPIATRREHFMDGTRRSRYDAYKAVCALVEELRSVKLFDAEADAVLWAAEGLLLANLPTDPEAMEAHTTFETLMDGLTAERWQDNGPTTAELQRRRLVQAFAECAPAEPVSA